MASLASLALIQAGQLFAFLLVADDLGSNVDQVGQVNKDFAAADGQLGASCRGRRRPAPKRCLGAGHRLEIDSHRLQQFDRRGVAAYRKLDRRLWRNVLPAANLTQALEHFLKTGKAGFDLPVLAQRRLSAKRQS